MCKNLPGFILLFLFLARTALAADLQVIGQLPEGQDDSLTQIVVIFSEDMRALGAMEQDSDTSPLQIVSRPAPLPAGNFRWLDTSTLAYIFDGQFGGPYTFEMTVPAGTTSLTGASLAETVHWSANTPPLALEYRTTSQLPRTGARIQIESNYRLDLEDLRTRSSIFCGDQKLDFHLSEDNWGYARGQLYISHYNYVLEQELEQSASLELRIEPGLKPVNGAAAEQAFTFNYRAFDRLLLESWKTGYGNDPDNLLRAEPDARLELRFNNPIHAKNLLEHIRIEPAVELDPTYRVWDFLQQSFNLPYLFESQTDYTVTISGELGDNNGTTLGEPVVFSFRTGDYEPLARIENGALILEKELGYLPYALRNVSPLNLRFSYTPWSPESTSIYSWWDNGVSGWGYGSYYLNQFDKLGDMSQFRVSLDFSDQRNVNILDAIKPEEFFAEQGIHNLDGPMELRLTWEQWYARTSRFLKYSVQSLLQITNLGVDFKLGRENGLAWVTGLSDGQPVPNAQLALYDSKGLTVWSGQTDAQGLAELPGWDAHDYKSGALLARTANDSSLVSLDAFEFDRKYPEYISRTDERRAWRLHALTQSPVYQPGETVNLTIFVGVFSDDYQGERLTTPRWLPVADEEIQFSIRSSRDIRFFDSYGYLLDSFPNRPIYTFTATTNAFGTVDTTFTLPENADLCDYIVDAKCSRFRDSVKATALTVASFRLPDFKVDLSAPANQPKPLPGAGPLAVELEAVYFSGASLPGAEVVLDIFQTEQSYTPSALSGYRTGLGHNWWWSRRGNEAQIPVISLQGILDQDGNWNLDLPEFTAEPGPARNIRLEATVTDASGLTTQGKGGFTLHASEYYLGMRGPRFVPAGRDAVIEFKAATFDSKVLAEVTFTLRAERYLGDDKTELVWEQEYTITDAVGLSVPVSFAQSGSYYLTGIICDPQGRENMTRLTLAVPGGRLEWLQLPDRNTLDLMSDEDSYRIGDTARIMFANPFEEGEPALALVSVEQGSILSHQIVEITDKSPSLDIPLDKDCAPYVFVSVTMLKGRTAPAPGLDENYGTEDVGRPHVAQGVILLEVDDPRPILTAQIGTDRQDYRPGGQVVVTVQVCNSSGQNKPAQVTLLAIDERVLRVMGGASSYYPGRTFEIMRSHGVFSADTRINLANLNLPLLLETEYKYMIRNGGFLEALVRDKVEDFQDSAAMEIRENFEPFVYWLAAGQTDADGKLEASFNLPDSLTQYRIVAVAVDDFFDFATAETLVTASKPLQLLSALPRFVVQDDVFEARVLVQNTGDLSGMVILRAEAGNLALTQSQLNLELGAGQSAVAIFEAKAGQPGEAWLKVTASMGEESDAAMFSLPVHYFSPLTTVATAGLLHEGESRDFPIQAPSPLDERSVLEISLAASPAAGMSLTAGNLLRYPWDCLEQRLTKAWVRAMRLEYGDLIGLEAEEKDPYAIREIMDSVPRFQQGNGGFSLWPNFSYDNFYLTAYVLLVNEQISPLGFALSDNVVSRAETYLGRKLAEASGQKLSDRPSTLAAEALSLYVLLDRQPDVVRRYLDDVLNAARQADYSSPLVWACLLKVADHVDKTGDMSRLIIQELEKSANITATQLHFGTEYANWSWISMGSNLRDNGMLLHVLSEIRPDYPRLEALAWWLSQGLGEKPNLSTQEGVFGLWSMIAYLESLGGNQDVAISATWIDGQSFRAQFERLIDSPESWSLGAQYLNPGVRSHLTFTAESGNPYWTARLSYASDSLPMLPQNAGFTLTREWLTPGPWKLGDIVEVKLTLTVPATRRHVLLFDPFPAGLEPEHATRVDLAQSNLQYPFQFEEMREDGVLLYSYNINPGTYTYTYRLRASTPGVFNQRPSNVEEMYTPEVFGRTAPDRVEVTPLKQ